MEKAQSAGGGRFLSLHYADLHENASQLGGSFDVIVCNFSLLGQDIQGILQSLADLLTPPGVLILQTLHPFSAMQNDRYEDGWREETFRGMGEGYRSPMPWYFRTIGSWLGEVQGAGFRLLQCQEPVHPATGMPLSLIITASRE
nr:class I SAM-dependent methyltransferase [Brevibacillus nitrificans]